MIVSAVIYLLFAALLVTAAVIDLRTLRIPNVLIVGLGALWLVWRVALACGGMIAGTDFLTSFLAPDPFKHVSFANGIIGSIALGGGLLVVTAVYEAVSKKRAMGGGDIKLLAVVGLFLGIERGIVCLFVACRVLAVRASVAARAVGRSQRGHRRRLSRFARAAVRAVDRHRRGSGTVRVLTRRVGGVTNPDGAFARTGWLRAGGMSH